MNESPIFVRTYDLLLWLIPITVKFPRSQRFVLAEAIQRSALEFQGQLFEASLAGDMLVSLKRADATLAQLRVYLRMSHDLKLLSPGQYRHVARMVNEVGSLLGGWLKTAGNKAAK